jgi:protein SCO1/2
MLVRSLQILTGVLLGLLAATWALGRFSSSPPVETGGEGSYFLPDPLPSPPFTLTSHQGLPTSSGDFPGKHLAVFFGYTSCPDVCPLTLGKLTEAFHAMGEEGERIQVLLISVDPERDSPQRLGEYLTHFHPSFLGLTGGLEELRRVADGFGVFFQANGTGEDYTVDHTARTFIVSPAGQIVLSFPVTATPAAMARDLSTLLEESLP